MGSDRDDPGGKVGAAGLPGPREQHAPSSPHSDEKTLETVKHAVEEDRSQERRYQSALLHRLRNAGN
jgi:hypothetical protein